MDVQNRRFACFTGVCLVLIVCAAYALNEKYVCMGAQRGQFATVTANSTKEAATLAKAFWGAAGCYKK
ncbi:hypothetical protein [Pseudomonas sp. A34-9]|uniref:hypothetical protein n=1 Tax=Pseudomonas sp. A34-9 TaxID=3034675 RepID=UPI00240D2CCB|nr:hypothetical protein [Pseudomonas sp. A34-9]